jgi:ubiquitin-conjugating enzyme E2 variant
MLLDPAMLVPQGPWWLVAVQAVGVYLLVDFISGIIHWSEDRYGSETTPFIGNAIRKNILHHHRPRHITRITLWEAASPTLFISLSIFTVGTLLGFFGWQLLFFTLLGMNVNTVHRWAHSTPKDLPWFIRTLQRLRLIQTPQHHAIHHGLPRVTHYCAFTNWMNPVLEKIRFWRGVEWCIAALTGIHPREDDSLPGSGPTPQWILDIDEDFRVSARERRAAET